jgi:hypothetical protein
MTQQFSSYFKGLKSFRAKTVNGRGELAKKFNLVKPGGNWRDSPGYFQVTGQIKLCYSHR